MTNDYKLNTTVTFNPTTVYWRGFTSGLDTFSKIEGVRKETSLDIELGSLSFLLRLTSSNELALQTVFVAVFSSLVERFFNDRYICKICREQKDILLHQFNDERYYELKEFLLKVKERFLEAVKHSRYEKDEISLDEFADCTLSFGAVPLGSSYDILELNVRFTKNSISLKLFYDQYRIEQYLAYHFIKYFNYVLIHLDLFFKGEQSIYDFLIAKDKELITSVNSTAHIFPENQTVITIFEERVEVTPNAVAIRYEGGHLNYLDFNEQANKFCDFLKRNYGIGSGDIVGLDLSRSEQMVISIFGILKSGAAYLPIEAKLPKIRKDFIIEDSGARLVINDELMDSFNIVAHELSPTNSSKKPEPSELAYVIYTSGSTGNPKGVMLEHGGLLNRLFWMQESYSLTEEDVLIQKTNYAFDVSVWEMLWWSLFGASLSIPFEGIEKDPRALVDEIHQENITVIHFVPSMLAIFLNYLYGNKGMVASLASLKQVYVSGEALPNKVRDDFFTLLPEKALMNLYGPTEATIDVTYFDCGRDVVGLGPIPIGKPIWNTKIHILDSHHCELPVGVIGNLYIESVGLARGYLNRQDLTAEKFIENRLFSNRIYDSGDVARWMPDGNIEFIGRSDFQVKIRGNRVELGDIENKILSYSGEISQAIVTTIEKSGVQVLTGYYTVRGNGVDRSELRTFLQERLPEYMVPTYLVELDSIPLTANGKLDRKVLSSVIGEGLIRKDYRAPRNVTEDTLVGVWEEVLGVEKVGITDNFFELGGHSLMVGQVLNRIHEKLSLEISFKDFFEGPTIEGIGKKLKRQQYQPISKAPEQDCYQLTPSQRRLWVLSQLEGGSQAYNMPAVVILKGNVYIDFLEKAFHRLINRHEILRTSFRTNIKSGDVNQYIAEVRDIEFNIKEFDFTEKSNQEIVEYLNESNKEIFNLENAPLLKVSLLKRGNEDHILFLSMHHLIGDGWSIELLVSEVVGNYNSLLKDEDTLNLDVPLNIQYRDYTVWLENEKDNVKYKRAELYWLGQFEGDLPILDLPSYRSRPLVQTYNGDHIQHLFSDDFTVKLNSFSQQFGATIFMTLVAGIKALLYRYTGQFDIIVGTPAAGRQHPDLENQIGLYLNTLAIRTRLEEEGGNSFASLLEKEKQALLLAYEHQCYPFDELISKLNIKRDRSRSALFDVLVVLQNQRQLKQEKSAGDLEGVRLEAFEYSRKTSQFDISYTFMEEDGRLGLTIGYNTDIYDRSLIERMFSHFENLLMQAMESEHSDIEKIDFLTKREYHLLLEEFNDTVVDYPKERTIIELFEEQVKQVPENIAVVFGNKEISYRELNERANQFGNYLRLSHSVNKNDLIIINLKDSGYLIEIILGILKSGAGYVPIDQEIPLGRIQHILDNIETKVIIDEYFFASFTKIKEQYSKENIPLIGEPKDITYIIYTSGTTGKPKGVKINSSNILDYYYGLKEKIDLSEINSYGMMSTIATDLGYTVLFASLLAGKTLHLFTKDQLRDFKYVHHYFDVHTIDCIKIVPSFWNTLNLPGSVNSPCKMIIFGGEALRKDVIEQLQLNRPHIQIVNHYGPTETTIGKVLHIIDPFNCKDRIPIGKPFSNTSLYVVDKNRQLVPVGVTGELLIGGKGVSDGYFDNEHLTSDKFILFKGERVYRTGDNVRWLPDGSIEFLGRSDFQVKIRGNRVELAEIENSILDFGKGIYQSVVIISYENDKLIAYYACKDLSIEKKKLKAFLQRSLPDYMIPSYFVQLDTLPLASNGKINRKSLPQPSYKDMIAKEYVGPRNYIEDRLVEIWKQTLSLEKIGITDDFFLMGGHSLLVAQLLNKMRQRLSLAISIKEFFETPTIEGISKKLYRKEYRPISKSPKQESYPLTPSQSRLWILSQLEGGSQAYNMPAAVTLKGNLNKDFLEKAFELFIGRHEIIRTSFRIDSKSGEVRQYIEPVENIEFGIDLLDFNERTKEEIELYLLELNSVPFDLERAPLLKVSLLEKGKNHYILFLSMHHLIGDGWSTELLISEMVGTYNRLIEGEGLDTLNVPLTIQYTDYAVWLQEETKSEKYKRAESYWLEQFGEELPVLNLPSFRSRPLVQTYNADHIYHVFSEGFTRKLKAFSVQHGVTLFMTLMTGIKSLLYRYSGQHDIVAGTPVSGREHPDLEGQIGLYLNTLAIRTKFKKEGGNSFASLLEKERETLLYAYEHQCYQFDELVSKLNIKRDRSRSPLFDVLVVLQNQKQLRQKNRTNELKGVQLKTYDYIRKNAQFDVSYTFIEEDGLLKLIIGYNTDIYDRFLIERMFSHFENLMFKVMESERSNIEDIDFMTEAESRQLLEQFNDTTAEYPKDMTVIDLFEEQVEKTPNNLAIAFKERSLSYWELNEQANQLGDYLRRHYQVKTDDLVAIKIERSDKMVVGILGILKSGAAYVPIDPAYPQERIDYIEKDAKAKVVIDNDFFTLFLARLESGNYNRRNLPIVNHSQSLAYVIYTSGTTGQPKGVMIENKGLVNLCQWHNRAFDVNENCKSSLFARQGFDASLWEIFPYLLKGASLYPLEDEKKYDIDKLRKFLVNTQITHVYLPPILLKELLRKGDLNSIIFLSGGDTLGSINPKNNTIFNNYGPTENSIVSSYFPLEKNQLHVNTPIGRPILNTRLYILDDDLRIVPIGVVGTLYLSGVGLSRGYLNNPDLTSEKFILNPFEAGTRMYNTGDLARWLPDGNVEFLGRKDFQVKISGYRIELEEIESNVFLFNKGIRQAFVDARKVNGNKTLIAYYSTDGNITINKLELRTFLEERLPGYMVPSHFIELKSLPMTLNGKIDRERLPQATQEHLVKEVFVSPKNKNEYKLAEIWQDVLGVDKVGANDNFFAMGGNSLLFYDLQHRIFEQLHQKVSFSRFFQNPTISTLASSFEGLSAVLNKSLTFDDEIPPDTDKIFEFLCYLKLKRISYKLSENDFEICTDVDIDKTVWEFSVLNKEKIFEYVKSNLPRDNYKASLLQIEIHKFIDLNSYKSNINFGVITSKLDADKFRLSIRQVIASNKILSSSFQIEGDDLFYKQIDVSDFEIKEFDFQSFEEVELFLEKEILYKFDIYSDQPLFKTYLIHVNEKDVVFFIINHIIFDGMSILPLAREFNSLYNGEEWKTNVPKLQFYEYAAAQRFSRHTVEFKNARLFWKKELESKYHCPTFDLSKKNNRKFDFYDTFIKVLSFQPTKLEKIEGYCRTRAVSLNVFLLALYTDCLMQLCACNDLIIDYTISGRELENLQSELGLFTNSVFIRTVNREPQFDDHLLHVFRKYTAVIENSIYDNNTVYKELELDSYGHQILRRFKYNFVQVNMDQYMLKDDKFFSVGRKSGSNYILLRVSRTSSNLICDFVFNKSFFSESEAQHILDFFENRLDKLIY